ncbi:MAG: isoprenylcysteine carboxylmethyltransferase family protein [Anaerolineae bacterium]|nr:isoprenylcysteine carboxylmethyltransferase family protein [Anaerolineae bacterium]
MSEGSERNSKPAASLAKAFIAVVVFALVLFLSAGTLRWPMGWVWVGIAATSTLIVALLADPALLRQRTQVEQAGAERWDIPLALIVGRIGPIAMLLVAGLDRRFGWSSPTPPALLILAFALLAVGYAVSDWAVIVNRFFAPVVQIQREQGHMVVTGGPYRWVRHPGYAGSVLVYVATPLILGSRWAMIPAALTILVVIIRTALEDRTLREKLPGYAEYAARVRWRLLPGVW